MNNNYRLIVLLVGGLALFAVPYIPGIEKNTLDLMISLFTIASLASSWNILAGMVGRINLGHVAFFGLGALTTRVLWLEFAFPFAIAFLLGGIVAAIAALIIGIPALRLKGIYFSVGTLAMAEALRLTVSNNFPRVSRFPGPMLRSYNDNFESRYFLSLAVLVLIVAFVYWLRQSKIGLGMMAIREDEEAARSIGINVLWHTMLAFIASAFFAGLTGGTFAFFHTSYYASLTFQPVWTFDALLTTFIGGIGTLAGPLVGAAFFILVQDLLSGNELNEFLVNTIGIEITDFHLVIFGIVFIFVVLVIPGGFVDIFTKLLKRFRARSDAMEDVSVEPVKNE